MATRRWVPPISEWLFASAAVDYFMDTVIAANEVCRRPPALELSAFSLFFARRVCSRMALSALAGASEDAAATADHSSSTRCVLAAAADAAHGPT